MNFFLFFVAWNPIALCFHEGMKSLGKQWSQLHWWIYPSFNQEVIVLRLILPILLSFFIETLKTEHVFGNLNPWPSLIWLWFCDFCFCCQYDIPQMVELLSCSFKFCKNNVLLDGCFIICSLNWQVFFQHFQHCISMKHCIYEFIHHQTPRIEIGLW